MQTTSKKDRKKAESIRQANVYDPVFFPRKDITEVNCFFSNYILDWDNAPKELYFHASTRGLHELYELYNYNGHKDTGRYFEENIKPAFEAIKVFDKHIKKNNELIHFDCYELRDLKHLITINLDELRIKNKPIVDWFEDNPHKIIERYGCACVIGTSKYTFDIGENRNIVNGMGKELNVGSLLYKYSEITCTVKCFYNYCAPNMPNEILHVDVKRHLVAKGNLKHSGKYLSVLGEYLNWEDLGFRDCCLIAPNEFNADIVVNFGNFIDSKHLKRIEFYKIVYIGAKIKIKGVFVSSNTSYSSGRLTFIANNVSVAEEEEIDLMMTAENIREIKSAPDCSVIIGKFLEIYETNKRELALAILLQQVGTPPVTLNYSTHTLRHTIHVLVIRSSDVGGKSTLGKLVARLSPNNLFSNGPLNSVPGIIGAISEGILMPGALLKSTNGVLVIDDLHLIRDGIFNFLNEPMEQMTISINKGVINFLFKNIHTTMPCATSILGLVGKEWNDKLDKNVMCLDKDNYSTLTRFDIILDISDEFDETELFPSCLLGGDFMRFALDKPDEDGNLLGEIKWVGENFRNNRQNNNLEFIIKYIQYAKSKPRPQLEEEAGIFGTKTYVTERQKRAETHPGDMQVCVRNLESLYRVGTAYAMLNLKSVVSVQDLATVKNLVFNFP